MAIRSVAIAVLGLLLWHCAASAQTPTALAEWQYSAGEALRPYFSDTIPQWRRLAGAGVQGVPRYEGASAYQPRAVLNFDLRYTDFAFASVVEGLGLNLWRAKGYRAGVALTADLGREQDDAAALNGLGDLSPAPEFKLFGEYVVFPAVIRADVRRTFGGKGGVSGDLGAYMPVVGNQRLIVFVGPALSFASGTAMQNSFGVSAAQAAATAYPLFAARGGLRHANLGVSATWFLSGDRAWFLNATGAGQRLLRDAARSPFVHDPWQYNLSLLLGRQW